MILLRLQLFLINSQHTKHVKQLLNLSDGNYYSNLQDSSNNERGIIVIPQSDAYQTKDIKGYQITEHKVIKMGRETVS